MQQPLHRDESKRSPHGPQIESKDGLLPEEWENDDGMGFMFSPMPSREDDPDHWDTKFHFWRKIILDYQKQQKSRITFTFNELQHQLTRKGDSPHKVLHQVLSHMIDVGEIQSVTDVLHQEQTGWWLNPLTWLSWILSPSKQQRRQMQLSGALVVTAVLKSMSSQLYSSVCDQATDAIDLICPIEALKEHCPCDVSHLDLLLRDLQRQGIVTELTPPPSSSAHPSSATQRNANRVSDIKVVKFISKSGAQKGVAKEVEWGVAQLKAALVGLERRSQALLDKIQRLEQTIRSLLKHGKKQLALHPLRQKKVLEREVDRMLTCKSNVFTALSSIQNQITNKMVVESMKSASTALNSLRESELSVESIEDLLSELSDDIKEAEAIDAAISQPVEAGIPDDELEKEYEALKRELEGDTVQVTKHAPSEPVNAKVAHKDPSASTELRKHMTQLAL